MAQIRLDKRRAGLEEIDWGQIAREASPDLVTEAREVWTCIAFSEQVNGATTTAASRRRSPCCSRAVDLLHGPNTKLAAGTEVARRPLPATPAILLSGVGMLSAGSPRILDDIIAQVHVETSVRAEGPSRRLRCAHRRAHGAGRVLVLPAGGRASLLRRTTLSGSSVSRGRSTPSTR